jgi:hypothetical protein
MQTSPSTESDQAAELAAELYLVPPARFVATRDQIARQASQAGRQELATRLRELRRPTQSAWLVNLLVRNEPETMAELRQLGRRLREAQTTLAGAELRRLSEQRRTLVGDLLELARQQAAEAGAAVTERALTEVESTLNAALVDLAAASAVMSGRLVRPMAHNGFGPRPQLPDEAGRVAAAAGDLPVGVPAAALAETVEVRAMPKPRPAAAEGEDDWVFWPARPEADPDAEFEGEWEGEEEEEEDEPAPVRHLSLVPPLAAPERAPDDQDEPPAADPTVSAEVAAAEAEHWRRERDLAGAEAAVRNARDELTWFDQHRMVARSEKVAAEMRLRQARAAQRASVEALHEARRALDAAQAGQAGQAAPRDAHKPDPQQPQDPEQQQKAAKKPKPQQLQLALDPDDGG